MTSYSKSLTENIKSNDYQRDLKNTELSTRTKFVIFTGTFQEVVNSLDTQNTPEHKVKGFAFTSAGRCEVIVHKH